MRYLYKINSRYDGFTPRRIRERLTDGRFLTLGWASYQDALNLRDEVWVVFIGGNFEHGVYVKGLVAKIDADTGTIRIRVREYQTTGPLTDDETSVALCNAVAVRYRQVFLWPEGQQLQEPCELASCGNSLCLDCDLWKSFPRIDKTHYTQPTTLRGTTAVPAYWIIPRRCYLYYNARTPAPWITRVTQMFNSFKVGEVNYSYPFAAGIQAALYARNLAGFDAIIPIPLSPEKAAAGELDRTAILSNKLGTLMGIKARNYLKLSGPISKRRMLAQGYTVSQFQRSYAEKLQLDPWISNMDRILLLDDVITKGSTLAVATAAIRAVNPTINIVLAAAGQMVLKHVVADVNGPAW